MSSSASIGFTEMDNVGLSPSVTASSNDGDNKVGTTRVGMIGVVSGGLGDGACSGPALAPDSFSPPSS